MDERIREAKAGVPTPTKKARLPLRRRAALVSSPFISEPRRARLRPCPDAPRPCVSQGAKPLEPPVPQVCGPLRLSRAPPSFSTTKATGEATPTRFSLLLQALLERVVAEVDEVVRCNEQKARGLPPHGPSRAPADRRGPPLSPAEGEAAEGLGRWPVWPRRRGARPCDTRPPPPLPPRDPRSSSSRGAVTTSSTTISAASTTTSPPSRRVVLSVPRAVSRVTRFVPPATLRLRGCANARGSIWDARRRTSTTRRRA